MEKEFMNFGDRLAYARKKKGLSQTQLAELVGVKNYRISKWEKSYSFDVSTHKSIIQKISSVLEVSEAWLNGSDDVSMESLNEDSKNIVLTKKQQQLVADNENVIGAAFQRFAREYRPIESYADFYGDAAINLCRAAKIYDEQYDNKDKFFVFAFVWVKWAMLGHFMKQERYLDRTTSLNKPIGQNNHGVDIELGDRIPSPDEWEQLEYKILAESVYQKIESVLGNKEKEAFRLYLLGNENPKVATALGISQHSSLCRIWRAKKKCRKYFNPDEIFS